MRPFCTLETYISYALAAMAVVPIVAAIVHEVIRGRWSSDWPAEEFIVGFLEAMIVTLLLCSGVFQL